MFLQGSDVMNNSNKYAIVKLFLKKVYHVVERAQTSSLQGFYIDTLSLNHINKLTNYAQAKLEKICFVTHKW